MKSLKASRNKSFLVILIIYILATISGLYTFSILEGTNSLLRLFSADFIATVVVWFFGVVFKNSSIYDPYWSVAPPIMLLFYSIYCNSINYTTILLLIVVWFWAIRLTLNWAYTFSNLTVQDWRYDKFKDENPRFWHIINFFGINLMPTIVVFLGMIPAIYLIELKPEHCSTFYYFALAVSIGATILQLVSDCQLHYFKKHVSKGVCEYGLWKYSRHPNYLGEILFWWGLFLSYLSIFLFNGQNIDWTAIIGAISITFLFLFVSIPLMEKRQLSKKPEYEEYMRRTRKII